MTARIEDYALIGDCETAALVARNGSIDWLCWPRFDSGACFAAILGSTDNGCWKIAPAGTDVRITRRYRGDTMILETDFETNDGAVRVTDFMPVGNGYADIIRVVTGLRGRVDMCCEIILRFSYGTIVPWVNRQKDGRLCAVAGPDMVMIKSEVELKGVGFTTVGEFSVAQGERKTFVMTGSVAWRQDVWPRCLSTNRAISARVATRGGRYSPALRRGILCRPWIEL